VLCSLLLAVSYVRKATKIASSLVLLIYFSSRLIACDRVVDISRTFCDEFLAVSLMFTFRNIDTTHILIGE